MPVGIKCPLNTVAFSDGSRTEWLKNESVAKYSAMGWAENIKWVQKPGDSRWKGEVWRRKENVNEEQQQNEEHRQMKVQQQNEMNYNNITKTSLEVLSSKVTLLGVFDL